MGDEIAPASDTHDDADEEWDWDGEWDDDAEWSDEDEYYDKFWDDFDIVGQGVIPHETFAAEVKVIGAAIQTGSSGYHRPVTSRR